MVTMWNGKVFEMGVVFGFVLSPAAKKQNGRWFIAAYKQQIPFSPSICNIYQKKKKWRNLQVGLPFVYHQPSQPLTFQSLKTTFSSPSPQIKKLHFENLQESRRIPGITCAVIHLIINHQRRRLNQLLMHFTALWGVVVLVKL